MAKKWLCGELSRLAGFNEVEEMADYLLSFPADDEAGLHQYIGELLGDTPETQQLGRDLVARQASGRNTSTGPRVGKAKKKTSSSGKRDVSLMPKPAPVAAPALERSTEKRLSQKERARLNRMAVIEGGGGGGSSSTSHKGIGSNHRPTGAAMLGGGIKVSYKSSASSGGDESCVASLENGPQSMEKIAAAEEALNLNYGTTPGGGGVVVNCLGCGYVNVIAARTYARKSEASSWGGCSACGRPLDRDAGVTGAAGFASALALKNRLVRYDAESIARTKVYDDESDYYTSAAWLSELEQEELRKRDAARHARLHTRDRNVTVSIDIAGRRVVEEARGDSVAAARERFLRREGNEDHRNVGEGGVSVAECTGGGSAIFASTDSGGHTSLTVAGSETVRMNGDRRRGDFSNETLTGRSAEVMATINYEKMKKDQTHPKSKNSEASRSDTVLRSQALTRKLAPWRQQNQNCQEAPPGSGVSPTVGLLAGLNAPNSTKKVKQEHKHRRNVQSEDDVSTL